MTALIEIIIKGVKEFSGQIVAAVLLAIAFAIFPSLRKLFRKKNESDEEVKQRLEQLQSVLNQTLQKDNSEEGLRKQLEILQQEEARKAEEARRKAELERQRQEKLREEQRLKAEIERKQRELKEAEARKAEEARQKAEAQKQLEEQRRKVQQSKSQQQQASQSATQLYEQGIMYYYAADYREALKYFLPAAEQGHAGAQDMLGEMYYFGDGVRQDKSEAVKWSSKAVESYRKAAEQGHAGAQNNLGQMYRNGEGVHKDRTEAAKWFRKAAEQEDTYAKKALKEMGY